MEGANTQQNSDNEPDVIYANINPDEGPTVLESLCVNCLETTGRSVNGKTTLLPTIIPMFKEVILMSFYCDECGYKNTEVQFAGQLADKGVKLALTIDSTAELQRDVIKSENAIMAIPELQLEIPLNKKSKINTVEGFLVNVIEDLEQQQEERRKVYPDVAQKIDEFIKKLNEIVTEGKHLPLTFTIDDPSGNSFIKNPFAPSADKKVKIVRYVRSVQQLVDMGYSPENAQLEFEQTMEKQQQQQQEQQQQQTTSDLTQINAQGVDFSKSIEESLAAQKAAEGQQTSGDQTPMVFETACHACFYPKGENKMCTIAIPYFKEVIVMAFTCPNCGAKSSETKVGGALSALGRRITLSVKSELDLKRDCYKSESARVYFPQIDLDVGLGTLGGVYTTVEGLIVQIIENMSENNPFSGDSQAVNDKRTYQNVINKLKCYQEAKEPFDIIIEDIFENSFVQNINYPNPDTNCKVESFERTSEQNDEWGLNDMNTGEN